MDAMDFVDPWTSEDEDEADMQLDRHYDEDEESLFDDPEEEDESE